MSFLFQFDGSRFVRMTTDGHVTLVEQVDFEFLPAARSYMFVNVTVTVSQDIESFDRLKYEYLNT